MSREYPRLFMMNQRTIIITGAGGGLGYELAKLHLTAGDIVYGLEAYLLDEMKALEESYENMHGYCCDISSEESVEAAVSQFISKIKRIDILYNNAGVCYNEAKTSLIETDLELCKKMMDVNAYGMIRVTKALWHVIQEGSVICNISSEAGSIQAARRESWYGYCMSKAALNMASKLLSNELWHVGARVINFDPGWLRSGMGGQEARDSVYSVDPAFSAGLIKDTVDHIEKIPRDQMFMTHEGRILPW